MSKKIIKIGNYKYSINYSEEVSMKVLDTVIKWMQEPKHSASSCGEGISQNDNCIIDSTDLICDIVDNILKPKEEDE